MVSDKRMDELTRRVAALEDAAPTTPRAFAAGGDLGCREAQRDFEDLERIAPTIFRLLADQVADIGDKLVTAEARIRRAVFDDRSSRVAIDRLSSLEFQLARIVATLRELDDLHSAAYNTAEHGEETPDAQL